MADVDGSAAGKGQEWTARLFKLVDTYEQNPPEFDGEAFKELYAKVERAIELSGESESQAYGLDQALFNAVSAHSSYRQVLLQTLRPRPLLSILRAMLPNRRQV